MSSLEHIIGLIRENKPEGVDLYLVGGYVRDRIMEMESKDIDLVTTCDPFFIARQLHQRIPHSASPLEFKRFGTVKMSIQGVDLEIVRARKEWYEPNSRKPKVVAGTLRNDIYRRDFTINCLMVDFNNLEEVLDLTGQGLSDLHEGLIRTPIEANRTFSEDPLRMIRAVVFAARFDFTIESECAEAIKRQVHRLKIVSIERIGGEFSKLLSLKVKDDKDAVLYEESNRRVIYGLQLALDLGLMEYMAPELSNLAGISVEDSRNLYELWERNKEILLKLQSADAILRLAVILGDIGRLEAVYVAEDNVKAEDADSHNAVIAQKALKRLKFPREDIHKICRLIENQNRMLELARRKYEDIQLRRLVLDIDPYLEELCVISRARVESLKDDAQKYSSLEVDKLIQRIKNLEKFQEGGRVIIPVSGEDVMRIWGIKGKKVGEILLMVEGWALEGEISPTDREGALERLRKLKDEGEWDIRGLGN